MSRKHKEVPVELQGSVIFSASSVLFIIMENESNYFWQCNEMAGIECVTN